MNCTESSKSVQLNPTIPALGSLADPSCLHEAVNIAGYSRPELVWYLTAMRRIRSAEERIACERKAGTIGGPVHLGIGQEAIPVGISRHLSTKDRVFGGHRSHGHLLALGSCVKKLFAEVLGKNSGHCKGMGGSMHLWDESSGFFGAVPIMAATVPLAVGAALASKLSGHSSIAVVYFGDGAVEEGIVHESLNLASVLAVPALFVVENNQFASHMHISLRQPGNLTARFGVANGIDSQTIDGNDVIAVSKVASEAIARMRLNSRPALIEMVTYRWLGHVDWRDDLDVGVNRSSTDLEMWKKRDPLRRLELAMIEAGMWSSQSSECLAEELSQEMRAAWASAASDPFPSDESLLSRVYNSQL